MLVLSRTPGESIVIDGGTIEVSVVKVCGDKVRIGIKAPKYVSVDRLEVYEAKERAKKAS